MYVKYEKNCGIIQEGRKQVEQKGIDITSSPASALPLRGSAVIGIVIGIMEHLMQMKDHGLALR